MLDRGWEKEVWGWGVLERENECGSSGSIFSFFVWGIPENAEIRVFVAGLCRILYGK